MTIKTYRCYGCKFPCECHLMEGDVFPKCPFDYDYEFEWVLKGSISEMKKINMRENKNITYANVHGWKKGSD